MPKPLSLPPRPTDHVRRLRRWRCKPRCKRAMPGIRIRRKTAPNPQCYRMHACPPTDKVGDGGRAPRGRSPGNDGLRHHTGCRYSRTSGPPSFATQYGSSYWAGEGDRGSPLPCYYVLLLPTDAASGPHSSLYPLLRTEAAPESVAQPIAVGRDRPWNCINDLAAGERKRFQLSSVDAACALAEAALQEGARIRTQPTPPLLPPVWPDLIRSRYPTLCMGCSVYR